MTSPDGMPPDALRELVREVLRDVLPTLANGAAPPGPAHPAPSPGSAHPAPPPGSAHPATSPGSAYPATPPGAAHLAPPPAAPSAPPSGIPATSSAAPPATHALGAAGVARAGGGAGAAGAGPQPVRLATDEDLHAFVLRVVALADNPKRRRDLLAGRLRFTLAPGPGAVGRAPANPAAGPVVPAPANHAAGWGVPAPCTAIPADHRIEKGAVTERAVQAAASAGARLVLGPRAVLTPLARDRARALGVPIEKER